MRSASRNTSVTRHYGGARPTPEGSCATLRPSVPQSLSPFPRRGFTLLELLVVLVILALLFSMIVPRFAGTDRRALQLVSDQVADLLTMYAHRATLGQKPVGVGYDPERRAIMLLVIDIDLDRPDQPADWQVDRLVTPVKLPSTVDLFDARADGEPVDLALWPIANRPGKDRPTIEITLVGRDGETTAVVLAPHAIAPRQINPDEVGPAVRMPIDLDAAGRHREEW